MYNIEYKSITNEHGQMIKHCIQIKNGVIQGYTLKEGEFLVTVENNCMEKPQCNGEKGIETATEEEVKYHYEHILD